MTYFQGMTFEWTRSNSEIFKSALMYLQVPQQKNPYLFPKFSVFVGSIEIAEQNASGELFLEFLFVNYFCINPLMHNVQKWSDTL